jgi:hypothetical protein
MTDPASAAPRTIRVSTLLYAIGGVVALAAAWAGWEYWSVHRREAGFRARVESARALKREFVPGEIVDQSELGYQVRILSCTPGSPGQVQGQCTVVEEKHNPGATPDTPNTRDSEDIALDEMIYRQGKGLPPITGRRSDAELAPMLASWKGAGQPVATAPQAPAPAPQAMPVAAPVQTAPAPQPAAASGGGLRPGEYACYGSGQTVLAGLGFKVDGAGNYTDLDGKEHGTVSVRGSQVVFSGGHLDGQTGRDLKNGRSFTIGAMASCDLWG